VGEKTLAFGVARYPASDDQIEFSAKLAKLAHETPVPPNELIEQFALYASPTALRRFLWLDKLYRQILDLPGIIMLFGVRWGRDLATFQAMQQIYEPMNYTRRIVGFDTFAGFPSVSQADGTHSAIAPGSYGVNASHEEHLAAVLAIKGKLGTFAHLGRIELCKGDAPERLQSYLKEHPETVVSMAYFDMDLYEPTKLCARMLLPYVTQGAVVAFDEYAHPVAPGETAAVREVFGCAAPLRRAPDGGPAHCAYMIYDGVSAVRSESRTAPEA
jgi:hypothetical protein